MQLLMNYPWYGQRARTQESDRTHCGPQGRRTRCSGNTSPEKIRMSERGLSDGPKTLRRAMRAYLFKLRFRSLKRRSLSAPLKKPLGQNRAADLLQSNAPLWWKRSSATIWKDRRRIHNVDERCGNPLRGRRPYDSGVGPGIPVGSRHRVEVVDNGMQAWKRSEPALCHRFHRYQMPDIDGLELLSAIKEYRPETEVIIVTGHGSMESPSRP